jgi:CelD/BcsL family acetyltransferase involved in cellulose biosynthesis
VIARVAAPAGAEPVHLPGGTVLRLLRAWPDPLPAAWVELWGDTGGLAPPLGEIAAHLRAGGGEIWTIELSRDGHPLAVIPLRPESRRVRGLALNVLASAGSDLYDYLPLAVAGEVPADDLHAALMTAGRRLRADALALDHLLPPCPPVLARYARSFENRCFDATRSADGWATLTRKESLRRHVARARRELQYSTTHHSGEISEALIREIAQRHIERWRFDEIASPFLRPERAEHYCLSAGRALVTVLRHGEEMLAAHFGLRAGDDTLLWHTPVINIRYLPWSPLEILLLETVEECARRGLRVLDYGLGEEAYKRRFSNTGRPVLNLFLPVSVRGRLAAGLLGLPAARGLRRRLGGWLTRLRTARAAVARRRCFAVSSQAVPPDVPLLVLREARDFPEYVDLMRSAGQPVRRPDYDRYRRGLRFLALVDGRSLLAGAWLRPVGESGEITDLRSQPGNPEALVPFLLQLSGVPAATRVVVTRGDRALLAACRAVGLAEIRCRTARKNATRDRASRAA